MNHNKNKNQNLIQMDKMKFILEPKYPILEMENFLQK